VVRFPHNDPEALERLLKAAPRSPRLICMDGVNSMTGNPPRLAEFAALAREHDALLYLDDAHGFGGAGSAPRTSRAPTGAAATASCATWGRATTTWC
jgi:8-amino-7-oxononanoate synthase